MTPQERNQAIQLAWQTGNLNYKLRPLQRKVRIKWLESRKNHTKFLTHCYRGLGKSFMWTLIAIEECLKVSNTKVIFIAPVEKKLRDYILPIFRTITQDCPDLSLLEYNSRNEITFSNGSILLFYSCSNESYTTIRGQHDAKLIILDEAAFYKDLDSMMDMIMPIIDRAENAYLIMSSTSPISPTHPFCKYRTQAMLEDWYIKFTIDDDSSITPEKMAKYVKDMNGRDSSSFKRELLCEITVDENRALCKEFNEALHVSDVKIDELYPHYLKYEALDF